MERREIGLLQIQLEAVLGVFPVAYIRAALVMQLEVRVFRDQGGLEGFSHVGAVGRYARIVVSQGLEAAYSEGVQLHVHSAGVPEHGVHIGVHRERSQVFGPKHPAQVEVMGGKAAAEVQVLLFGDDVFQIDIGQDFSQVRVNGAFHLQVVQQAGGGACKAEALSVGQLLKVQIRFGGPGLHKAAEAFHIEIDFLHVHLEAAVAHFHDVLYGSGHIHLHPVVCIPHRDIVQEEVVHRAMHVAPRISPEGAFHRGKMTDGVSHIHQGTFFQHPVQHHLVHEISVVVQTALHVEMLQVDVGIAVVYVHFSKLHKPFSHTKAPGRYFLEVKAGFLFVDLQDGVFSRDEVVGYLEVIHRSAFQQHVQVVPVYDAFLCHDAPFLVLPGQGNVYHPERKVFEFYLPGGEKIAPAGTLGLFFGRFEAQDARKIDFLVFFRHQVEAAAVEPQTAHIGALALQKAPQGKLDGQAVDVEKCVHPGHGRVVVQYHQVFQKEGFRGTDRDVVEADGGVHILLEPGNHLLSQIGLDGGGLDGHQPRQQQNCQQTQDPDRYFEAALHYPTKLTIILYLCTL